MAISRFTEPYCFRNWTTNSCFQSSPNPWSEQQEKFFLWTAERLYKDAASITGE